jgi:A/G-specific adenine glycosylase
MGVMHLLCDNSTHAWSDGARLASTKAEVLSWAKRYGRTFPWRATTDPYRLVVTEFMLIRTRAEAVAAVWAQFFAAYPSRAVLAASSDDDVADALRTLGLRWRTDLILAWAREKDPTRSAEGRGPYVTAAVKIGATGHGRLPIDVTIARVIARLLGTLPGPELRRSRVITGAVDKMGDVDREAFHAFLDLAALVCLPKEPHCFECPLLRACETGQASTTTT